MFPFWGAAFAIQGGWRVWNPRQVFQKPCSEKLEFCWVMLGLSLSRFGLNNNQTGFGCRTFCSFATWGVQGAFIEGCDLKGVEVSTYIRRHSIRAQEFSDHWIESRLKINVSKCFQSQNGSQRIWHRTQFSLSETQRVSAIRHRYACVNLFQFQN